MEGRSGGLLSGEHAHSVRFHDLANIAVSKGYTRWHPPPAPPPPPPHNHYHHHKIADSRGCTRWHPAYVESERAGIISIKVDCSF